MKATISKTTKAKPKVKKRRKVRCSNTQLLKEIIKAKGFLTVAAKKAGLTYHAVYHRCKEFPALQEAADAFVETQLDATEQKLFDKITKNDTQSIMFYLRMKGRKRGYIEKQEVVSENKTTLKTVNLTTEQEQEYRQGVLERVHGNGNGYGGISKRNIG
jgi:molybdenum-dependent DNA-binding transcriptional regulator ModE